ncbi:AbgT family transporter, partial [Selenomonas sp.]|uniref:AbgT family transporter n=1 Tax=Selenomonas sp. TaxID=2053611 RepID=UPI001CB30D88
MATEMHDSAPPKQESVGGILGWIEKMGNRIPDITMLFICAFVITCVLSAILSQMHFDYVHPSTGAPIEVTNMMSPAALVTLLTKMVTNYTGFPPLGMVIVAPLGIGIADGS